MNRTLSKTTFGLLFLAAIGMVTGGAAQPHGASGSGAAPSPVVDLPVSCLFEKNHGSCVTCCMEATDAPALVCSRFCKSIPPPLPGPEPEP